MRERPEADPSGFDALQPVRNGSLSPASGKSRLVSSWRAVPVRERNSPSSSPRRLGQQRPSQSFPPSRSFYLAMNVFLWSLTLLLVASTSHAIRLPVSRYKLSGSSPLEKRAQGHSGVPYNVLATGGNSSEGLKLVYCIILSILPTISLGCESATSRI